MLLFSITVCTDVSSYMESCRNLSGFPIVAVVLHSYELQTAPVSLLSSSLCSQARDDCE